MSEVLGEYYDTMDVSYIYTDIEPSATNANPVMAKKRNSRFVMTTEPNCDKNLNSSILKRISGGDTMQVRDLYGKLINYTPKFKLVIQTNTLPIFSEFDGGLMRRIILIDFPNKFVENPVKPYERKINTSLKHKITTKYYNQAFFNILVKHFNIYLKEGLIIPKTIKDNTMKYISELDLIYEWVNEMLIFTYDKNDRIKSSELLESCNEYYVDNPEMKMVSSVKLKSYLMKYNIQSPSRSSDGKYYTGLKFKK